MLPKRVEPFTITFDYTNWRGEERHRRAVIRSVYFGTTEYYPEPTWLLDGVDLERNVERTYRASSMRNVMSA